MSKLIFFRLFLFIPPKAIIFFCGTNDINGWNAPREVFKEFKKFYFSVKEKLPNTKVFAISIQPSPSRFDQRKRQLSWNKSVEDLAESQTNLIYINVSSKMLAEDNKPMPELYTDDMLHMNEKGYKIWAKIIRENLKKFFPKDFDVEI